MTLLIKLGHSQQRPANPIPLRCPGCRRDGNFDPVAELHDVFVVNQGTVLGHRACPNPDCRTHVFVVWDVRGTKLVASYPAERIDFDASNIPPSIVRSFEEALTCHADQCYVAAAMLVRKTLEQVCLDRGAKGKNLHDRLKELRNVVILPGALFDAADSLRLLGNDAAHIEADTYNDVGENEVKVAIALTKEILKSIYQYDALLGQLNALKK